MRRWEADQTSILLGDTISLSETQWREATLLPGWSRAHIAAHLARNADLLGWIALNPRDNFDQLRDAALENFETEADRPGLSLQIDLDTSTGALARVWDTVTDWNRPVRLLNSSYQLSVLPLIRLHEVSIHRLDLNLNANLEQLEPTAAAWLLRWVLHRMEHVRCSEISITSDSGLRATLGRGEPRYEVHGPDALLWAWLAGRVRSEQVPGANGLTPGLLS